ncbi:hypothetical protein ZWY2020_035520 [Hordeum vulgare]|nr:hypothetical protein ZWY2020_035520 [Hordeum vulgare]
MRAVSGPVVSSKPVALNKAARVFSRFAARDASVMPAGACALVLCAAEAAAELHATRAAPDGDAEDARRGEKRGKKRRRRAEREGVSLEHQ